MIWETAHSAPHRYAKLFDQRVLVILDEFQHLAQFVYADAQLKSSLIESLPGSFHGYSESKIAPMLVTGSYVGLLMKIMSKHLEGGRLKRTAFAPYLTPEAGLEAVYRYAQYFDVPITNESALQINRLCMSDAFFISCVIQSEFDEKDLTTEKGVVDTVDYEISYRHAEMSET